MLTDTLRRNINTVYLVMSSHICWTSSVLRRWGKYRWWTIKGMIWLNRWIRKIP